jgi:type I restriction enzyme S subunit
MSQFPTDWDADRLKDIALINGSSLPANTHPDYEFDYLEISNVNYYGVIYPDAIEHLRYEDAPSRARRRVRQSNTIISSVRPNLQAIAFMSDGRDDLVCSTGFNVVRAIEPKLQPKFAYYTLISEGGRQYLEAAAKGVGYPAVDDKDFGSFRVPLPTPLEQERIATYLDASCVAIDAAVAGKRRQIETLDVLGDSVIESAVINGVHAGTPTRSVNEDWITKVPSHWDVCRIKRVVSRVDYGISLSTEPRGRYPVLKMGHIQRREITYSDLNFVDEVPDNLLLENGDLLYNRTNSPDQVGKAAIFRRSKSDEVTFASYLVRLRTNHLADPHFLIYVINCTGFLSFARKLAIPSVQQSNLNSTRYCRLFIPRPPLREQHQIAEYLNDRMTHLACVANAIEKQITALVAYRKSLIQEYVTGQRRVTEADLNRVLAHG